MNPAERLTEEKQIGVFASLRDKSEAIPGAFANYDCLFAHMTAVARLKEYEDIGLSPEEIMEKVSLLKQYEDTGLSPEKIKAMIAFS